MIIKGFSAKYEPKLSQYEKIKNHQNNWVKFDEWWNEIILKDQKGKCFSRKSLTLFVANTDSGERIDKMLSEDYFDLPRNNSIGFSFSET